MKTLKSSNWLMLLVAAVLMLFAGQARAQAVDDLQEYLDRLAAEQAAQTPRQGPRKAASVEVPVGLTEVDLSKFTSYQNRTTGVTVKASVKFTNGTITAASTYAGGTCLLKVYDGATVVLGETAGVDASAASTTNCIGAVGIYGGSTFYQCGDITAPASCTGHAIWMETAADTYYYVSGSTCGDIYNPNSGTVVGVDEIMLGDVNQDGMVTLADIAALCNLLIGASSDFCEEADLNGDGMVAYSDLMSLIYLVYERETYGNALPSYVATAGDSNNRLYMNTTQVTAGSEVDLPIRLKNTANIVAFQFTLSLPSGFSLVTDSHGKPVVTLSDARAISEGALYTKVQTDGSLTVSYAPASVTPISGTDGEVVKVRVRVDASLAAANYTAYLKDMYVGTDVATSKVYYFDTPSTATLRCVSVTDPSSLTPGEYVDLGLPSGTLWATHNIGATNPEDYGDYFAWGETTTKSTYRWSTYTLCNGSSSTLTKYNNSSGYGTVDNKTELEQADDAAYVNWGSDWRMPSLDQLEELINSSYTTTTWTTVNGVYGRKITSKSNGNSIFLPAAGCRHGTWLDNAGPDGYYWSRTLNTLGTSDPSYARTLYFFSSSIGTYQLDERYGGQSVRPVRSSILLVESITLTPATLALTEGATSQLTATVTPSGATNPALTWSSSNTSIATVSSTGLVTAVGLGTAVITCAATDGSGVKATCQVTVNPEPTDPSSLTPGEYVDLGLPSGTLWATHNIGATNPEDYGDYFAWGETTTKSTYTESNYTYSASPTELPTSADAAYVNWGSQWRMPSLDQLEELINSSYTTTTWTTVNGVYGRKITSKSNGNSIFLPAAGSRFDTSLNDAGSYGLFWSRTLSAGFPHCACSLHFYSSNVYAGSNDRFIGQSVRPVRASVLLVENITLTPATLALAEGATSQLTATVTPSGATNPALTWSSSNTSIATVSSTGLVTAVATGTAVITCAATDGSGVTATCQVTVTLTYAQLKAKLDAIQTELDGLYTRYNQAKTLYESVYGYLTEAQQTEVETKMGQVKTALDALQARKNTLATQLESAATSAYPALNTQIETLAGDVADFKSSLIAELNSRTEEIKTILATKLQGLLTTLGNDVAGMQNSLNSLQTRRAALAAQVGEGYFLYKPTAAFAAQLDELDTQLSGVTTAVQTLIAHYNALVSGTTISTIQEAVAALQQYENVAAEASAAGTSLTDCTSLMTAAETAMETLEMTFPDESLAWTLRPTGLTEERQLGYKSNRGFVITSAGMMWFERKEGADFYLRDAENNYIVATSGQQTLTTGTKAEATVWTGRNLLNGSYTIQGKAVGAHLGYGGVKVNSPIIADANNAYAWTLTESTLDDLQAFLNLLAEEEEVENSGEGTLTETDTLVVHVPVVTCDCNHNPFVFPIVPYPIIWRGAPGPRIIPLPRPVSGNPGEDFHPIHIPDGSHVILDEVDFNDIVGGHHVIYVDGVLEINVTVNIYVVNWEWFIKVGPHGRVIWRPRPGTGCWPRIWNEGTLDMEEGEAGYVDNRGTVNHKDGTIGQVVNRRTYRFTGGIVNDCRNYGEYDHVGGNVLTARNFEDGTYNMTGGSIGNTVVVNVTDTVFVNCGRFYFRGGWLRGYGSRLIWHKRGAYMWLDGGQFDVTHIHDYFIEAHDEFYIRGDYNVSLPMLLEPTVIVRILYKWTYKFNIVFIGGRPRPRYPLFWGYDFTLGSDFYKYIGWDLPNRRWRWYYKSEDNTIEPRDEEVYDEDDLQAYLDWLAENQDGEAASTEAAPQELDLGGRDIVITQPVVLPVGSHVFIRNGRFVPGTGWTAERMFYIPSGCSMRYEHVVFDFSSSTYYLVGGIPRHRYIFDIVGHVRFGTGCRVIGYYDFGYTATDDYLPGAAFRIDPSARLYLDGAEFTNVVFRLNVNVNIYLTVGLLGKIWFYVPEAYRYTGFRLIGTDGGYGFSTGDLDNIGLVGLTGWGVETDEGGYGVLKDRTYVLPDLTLDESTDNTALLETYDGETTNVTLKRTLQPGGWNTFCVPFAMDAAMVVDKLGTEAVVKQLDHSVLDGDILTLYFVDATAIEAGRAYLVSVVGTLADPVFEGVTVSKYPVVTETAYADFVPALSPVVLRSGDKKSLFVVGGNTLTFPSETSTLKSFRGYFHLHDVPAGVRLFNMDFENTWTGVEGLDGVQTADEWYTLDGRKLSGKPVQKGIYVKNGCKVMVK